MSARNGPDLGPYMIEVPQRPFGGLDTEHCSVVDTRKPIPDPLGEGGKGWVSVFSGTYSECDAWIEAHDNQPSTPSKGADRRNPAGAGGQ